MRTSENVTMLWPVSRWTPIYTDDQKNAVIAAGVDNGMTAAQAARLLSQGRLSEDGREVRKGSKAAVAPPSKPMPPNTATHICREERRRREGKLPVPDDLATLERLALRTVARQWQQLEKESERKRLDPRRIKELAVAAKAVKELILTGQGAGSGPSGQRPEQPDDTKPKGLLDQLAERMGGSEAEGANGNGTGATRADTSQRKQDAKSEDADDGATRRTTDGNDTEAKTERGAQEGVPSRAQPGQDHGPVTGRQAELGAWRARGGRVASGVTTRAQRQV